MNRFLVIPFCFFYSIVMAQVPPTQDTRGLGSDIAIGVPEGGIKGAGYYQQDSKYGFVTPEGVKQPAIYSKIDFSTSGFIIQKDKLYGIANKKGQLLGNIDYDSVGTASETAYIVKKKDKYGTISTSGDKILSIKYDKVLAVTNFVSFVQSSNGHIQMIFNEQEKAFAASITYAAIYANLVVIKADGKFGVAKKQLIMPLYYDSIFVTNAQVNSYNSRTKATIKKYVPIDKSNSFKTVTMLTLRNGNKFGLADSDGALIYPVDNDAVYNQELLRYYSVKKGNLFGIYFINSKQKTGIEFDKVYADGLGYVMADKNQKGGVFNLQGKQIVPFEYDPDFIMQYRTGFRVKKNKKIGMVSKDGLVVVPPIYDEMDTFYEDGLNNFIKVKSGGKSGMVNLKGEVVIPVIFEWIGEEEGFVKVETPDKKFGLYDKSGKVVIPAEYQWIINSDTEHSPIIVLKKDDNSYNFLHKTTRQILLKENVNGFGYVLNQDDLLNTYSSSRKYLLFVKANNGKTGMLNEATGVLDIPLIYDDIVQRLDGGKHVYFSVRNGKKYGLIDETNRQIIPLQYDAISLDMMPADDNELSNAFVAAKGNKYGTVNLKNQTLIPFLYTQLQRISGSGLYKAKAAGYYQVINSKNEIINKGPFDEVANFESGREPAYQNEPKYKALTFYKGKMRVIDDQGKFITSEVVMEPHNGYKTFDELKWALIKALDSKDNALLKDFAEKIAPSEHILFYLKSNAFNKRSLENTNIKAIKEKYYNDLLGFKLSRWNKDSGFAYNKASLTEVRDYTHYDEQGFVTNARRDDPVFGDTYLMEKLLRDAFKINGYWISSYFMKHNFERF